MVRLVLLFVFYIKTMTTYKCYPKVSLVKKCRSGLTRVSKTTHLSRNWLAGELGKDWGEYCTPAVRATLGAHTGLEAEEGLAIKPKSTIFVKNRFAPNSAHIRPIRPILCMPKTLGTTNIFPSPSALGNENEGVMAKILFYMFVDVWLIAIPLVRPH